MPNLIGTGLNQIPTNADLGSMAHQDSNSVAVTNGSVVLGASVTQGYFQNTDISDVRPSLMFDFANSKFLDSRVTFSRGSAATYYDGKTFLKAEENLIPNSQDFTTGLWTSSGVVKNATVAPDGTTTASYVYGLVDGAIKYISGYPVPQSIPYGTYVSSIYAKAGSKSVIQLSINAGGFGADARANFDLANGVLGTVDSSLSATITSIGNGWYRCSVVKTGAIGTGQVIWVAVDSTTATREQGSTPGGLFMWGVQLEQRSAITTYVPTTSYPVTKTIPALQLASLNSPRFDHDPITNECKGLMIEEQRSNSLLYSQFYEGTTWGYNSVTAKNNAAIAPDGTLTAIQMVLNSGTGRREVQKSTTTSVGSTYTFSVYAKKDGIYNRIIISESGVPYVGYNLSNGTVYTANNATGYITPVGNDWYRLSFVYTAAYSTIYISAGTVDEVASVFSNTTGNGFNGPFIWGAQLEAGAHATSYIPTTSAGVTRAGDYAGVVSTNFSNFYNPVASTAYMELSTPIGFSKPAFSFQYSAQSTSYHWTVSSTAGTASFFTSTDAGSTPGLANLYTYGAPAKVVIGYAAGNTGLATSGGYITQATVTSVPNKIDSLRFGTTYNTTPYTMWIKKFIYYPQRLSNAELQEMTL